MCWAGGKDEQRDENFPVSPYSAPMTQGPRAAHKGARPHAVSYPSLALAEMSFQSQAPLLVIDN